MSTDIELYPRDQTDFSHHGYALDDISNDIVTWQLNAKFTLTFDYPMFSEHAGDLVAENIVRVPVPGGKAAFRIAQVIKSMGHLSITAYHVFWDLNDDFIADTNIVDKDGQGALDQIMRAANYPTGFKVISTIGNVTNARLVRMSIIKALLGTDDNSFLNRWGGEFDWQDFSFSVNPRLGKDRGVHFEYAHNLTGYEATKDSSGIITRLLPEGYNGLLLPELYVDSPKLGNYRKPKIGTKTYQDIKAIDETQATGDQKGAVPVQEAYELLRAAATKEFSESHIDEAKWTYKLNVALLENTEEYKDLSITTTVLPGDTVTITHKLDDIDVRARLTGYTWQPSNHSYLTQTYDSTSRPDVAYSNLSSRINEIKSQIELVDKVVIAKATNGMNSTGWGDQSPVDLNIAGKTGDVYYQTTAKGTIMWLFHDGQWNAETGDAFGTEVQKKVDTAIADVAAAKQAANDAVAKASAAVSSSGLATTTANAANDAATAAKHLATEVSGTMATVQSQAANAATQANQAVTDASTAKADANTAKANATQAINDAATAKGQASNAIGQANTAIGNALTALNKVNGMSVGGTNLILNSSTPQVLKRPDDNPNYPNWVGRNIYQGLKNNKTYTLSALAKAVTTNKSAEQWGIRIYQSNGNHEFIAKTLDANTGKRQSLTFTTPDDGISYDVWIYAGAMGKPYTPEDLKVVVTVSDYKLETGTMATDWSPAPEDVQIQIDSINGELSQKVSQTTYNTLAGTVDTVSTLAKQNQSTIGTLATKTSVDTINKTVQQQGTAIEQNSDSIKLKANQSTVDTLSGKVSDNSAAIKVNADGIALKADKSTVDTINKTVTTTKSLAEQTANGLTLKADTSVVDTINNTVKQQAIDIKAAQDKLALTLTASDLTNGLSGYATQTWTQNQIQTTADGINSTLSSVKTTVDDQTTSINDLKADSSSFKSQFTTVNNTLGKQTTDIGTLQATSKELTTGFNTLTTDNNTNKNDISQLKQTATEVSSTLETVQTQVQNTAVGGVNLLKNTTADVKTASNWNNQYYNGPIADLGLSVGDRIIYSAFLDNTDPAITRGSSNVYLNFYDANGQKLPGSSGNGISHGMTGTSSAYAQIPDHTVALSLFEYTNNQERNTAVGKRMLERGTLATDWSPNPADNASVTAFSQLSQTVDGLTATFATKNDLATTTTQVKATASGLSAITAVTGTKGENVAQVIVDVNNIKTTMTGANGVTTRLQTLEGFQQTATSQLNEKASQSQITQLQGLIDERVTVDGKIAAALSLSADGGGTVLITGKSVHITGETTIDNAVIKSAMIDTITADKIIAGTLNAANLNVINLNASAIVTGTISGANLAINLNTGMVEFQKGRIHSTDNNIDINVDQKYISVTDSNNSVLLKGGSMTFTQPYAFDTDQTPYLTIDNVGSSQTLGRGAEIVGRDVLTVSVSGENNSFLSGVPLFQKDFSGISISKNYDTVVGGANRGVRIIGGGSYSTGLGMSTVPSIMVGYNDGAVTGKGSGGTRINIEADYVQIPSAWSKTTSSSPNAFVASDGALVRSTSASKYKVNIERTRSTDLAERLLTVPNAHWLDKAASERYASGEQKELPQTNFGLIAEDLEAAGLEDLVVRGPDGELEGIQYDRIAAALLPLLAQMKTEIDELKATA